MTPRLRVGDRAMCVTEDTWNRREVVINKVRVSGYMASDGWDEQFFADDELVPLPEVDPSPLAAWVLWLLTALAVVGAVVIVVLGSQGAS